MKRVIVGEIKEDLINAINDINFKVNGEELIISDEDFTSLWRSDFIMKFFKKTNILIDDFETTIIIDNDELQILKETIENSSFFKIKNDLHNLVKKAINKKSGIVFLF